MHVLFFLSFSRLLICLCVCYCILYLCYHFYGEIKFIYIKPVNWRVVCGAVSNWQHRASRALSTHARAARPPALWAHRLRTSCVDYCTASDRSETSAGPRAVAGQTERETPRLSLLLLLLLLLWSVQRRSGEERVFPVDTRTMHGDKVLNVFVQI